MDNNTVYVNESINCYAAGEPSPTYRWKDITANTTVNGPTIYLYELGPRTLECTATNVYNGVTYTNTERIDILVISAYMTQFLR
jgi:hypothetical protein